MLEVLPLLIAALFDLLAARARLSPEQQAVAELALQLALVCHRSL